MKAVVYLRGLRRLVIMTRFEHWDRDRKKAEEKFEKFLRERFGNAKIEVI